MRYGDKHAVDGLSLSAARGRSPPCSGPTAPARPPRSSPARATAAPQAGPGARARPRPTAQRADLLPRVGVMLQSGGVCPASAPSRCSGTSRACTRTRSTSRCSSSGSASSSCGAHAVPAALRRPAAAARRRARGRRTPRAGLPRRAHRRPGPAGPAHHVGAPRGAAARRRDRRADHPLHGRGRAAGRPGARDRPRPAGRLRHPVELTRGSGTQHDPAGGDRAVPADRARVAAGRARRRGSSSADQRAQPPDHRARPTRSTLATVSAWCDDARRAPGVAGAGPRTLEDVFLRAHRTRAARMTARSAPALPPAGRGAAAPHGAGAGRASRRG